MALTSTHTTTPDASFTGTGSAAWVAPHGFGGVPSGALVGRFNIGTGAPEDIFIGSGLSMAGGTLVSTAASGVALVEGVSPILVTGTATSTVALATSGVAAGTYGGANVMARFDISAQGIVVGGTNIGTLGTLASFNSYSIVGEVSGTSTTGTLTAAYSGTRVGAGDLLGTSTTNTFTGALSTTGVIAGTYGNGTNVGQFTVDAKGRMTFATNVNIAGAGTLAVSQGTTTVASVNRIVFTTGATVTSTAAGIADVAVSVGTGGGSAGPTFPGGIPLTGVSYPRVKGDNLSAGDNDLYTVPAGKRAIISSVMLFNTSAGNIAYYLTTKNGGTYYRLANTSTVAAGTAGQSNIAGYIFDAGEVISVNTATNNGANVVFQVVQFDDTCLVYSAKVLSLANGDNTIYTVPSGKTAFLIPGTAGIALGISGSTLFYVNTSGGARAISWNIVNSGGSVATTNQVCTTSTNVNDVTRNNQPVPASLNTGDFINLNTNAGTATQIAWVNVVEI